MIGSVCFGERRKRGVKILNITSGSAYPYKLICHYCKFLDYSKSDYSIFYRRFWTYCKIKDRWMSPEELQCDKFEMK